MAFAPGQGNDQGLCLASPGCRLLPGCICGVPSIQHKAQIPPLGNRESSCQLLAQRIQGQKPGATDHGSTESCFAHAAHRPKGWAELGGISANGQLVTKPTLFLKLGHSRETGTAELSPNRTVAHLVPGPSGTPGRGGGGVGRWPLPRMERQSKAWRVGRKSTSWQSVLMPSRIPSWKVEGPLPLTPAWLQGAPYTVPPLSLCSRGSSAWNAVPLLTAKFLPSLYP